jgi:hypothetical protein
MFDIRSQFKIELTKFFGQVGLKFKKIAIKEKFAIAFGLSISLMLVLVWINICGHFPGQIEEINTRSKFDNSCVPYHDFFFS